MSGRGWVRLVAAIESIALPESVGWTALNTKVTLTTAAQFPKDYFLENLAARSDGSILVTAVHQKELWHVPRPDGEGTVQPGLVHTFEHLMTGIAEVSPTCSSSISPICTRPTSPNLARVDLNSWTPGTRVSPKIAPSGRRPRDAVVVGAGGVDDADRHHGRSLPGRGARSTPADDPGPRSVGGVGLSLAQLAAIDGVAAVGTCSEAHFASLRRYGATAIEYGEGLQRRAAAVARDGVDAAVDLAGRDEAIDASLALVSDRSRAPPPADRDRAVIPQPLRDVI